MYSLEDVKMYIHEKGQFLELSGRMGYKMKTQEHVESQLNIHEIK
jgi:hypothetical protein